MLQRWLLPAADAARRLIRRIDPHGGWSFAQEGEDRVLWRLLEGRETGFYVDVGAFHPRRFSNTRSFYERGWRGINIEPSMEGWALFRRERPRDTNLQLAVCEAPCELAYYVFEDAALNTLDRALADARSRETPYRMVETRQVQALPLAELLRRHLPAGQKIDFLSVDAEGSDLQVLRSNDWRAFRPDVVLVEALDFQLAQPASHPVDAFMRDAGYRLVAKTVNTLFYA